MSGEPKIIVYPDLNELAVRLRSDVKDIHCVLLFAFNRTGKTRLSMAFKERGKQAGEGARDTLYFNAFTEDLFVWHNDLAGDADRHLKINQDSAFLSGLKDLALDETIDSYLQRYADFQFDINYTDWIVTFRKGDEERIKVSRGEEKIFIWCVFMAICERVIDGLPSYRWVKYLYIDDPISSLDDNNAIMVASDLADLLRKAAARRDDAGEPDPLSTIFSTHHALFFNVMCNELTRRPEDTVRLKVRQYFLHKPNGDRGYTLRATDDTPYFHHVATLAELQRCVEEDRLYTYHFNALRSVLERTASFLGHPDLRICLAGLEDEGLYNRALNVMSHGRYAIAEPREMVPDNKVLFQRILTDVLKRFQFALPNLAPPAAPEEPGT